MSRSRLSTSGHETRKRVPVQVGWIAVAQLIQSLGVTPASGVDREWADLTVKAVNRFIRDTRPDLPYPTAIRLSGQFSKQFSGQFNNSDGTVIDGNPRITMGALMLAQAWYSRRGTGQDIAEYAELGGPPPSISRDIEVMLGIGYHFDPVAI